MRRGSTRSTSRLTSAASSPTPTPAGSSASEIWGARRIIDIGFRALERSHFTLLASWLAEPLVARWWNHAWTAEALERDFGPSIDGADPAEFRIAELDGRPFGLIQRYPIAAYPEYVAELEPLWPTPAGTFSTDYLVGEAGVRGRGLGARMIAAFVGQAWTELPGATGFVVPVSAANRASWRSLEGAGFARVARGELTPDNPVDGRDHLIYALRRPEPGAAIRAA